MKKIILILTSISVVIFADFIRNDIIQTVVDDKTNLEWQDNENVQMSWSNAILYCENLSLGGYSDWRLPDINELNSLVYSGRKHPTISPIFKRVYSYRWSGHVYWTSTTYKMDTSSAWSIYFGEGNNYVGKKNESFYIRCVRAGQ